MQTLVSKIQYQGDIKKSVGQAVNFIGGWQKFISSQDRVLLKPNFNTADPFPASTSMDFLRTVIELLKERINPKEIILGESSTHSLNTRKTFEKLGALELVQELGVKAHIFDEEEWIKKEIPQGRYLKRATIPKILDEVDKLILLPCLKTHIYARFTMSLKLAVGFFKKIRRARIHLGHLGEKIAELNTLIRPNLIIMDARKCFVTRGPITGEVQEPNLIFASNDRIAIDIEGLKILKSYSAKNRLDLPLWEFPQIRRATELGLGVQREEQYQLIEMKQDHEKKDS